MNFLNFVKDNLSHVLPVLLAGALGLAIIIERSKALFVSLPLHNSKAFFERINALVLGGKMQEAVALCDQHASKPAARIVKTALGRAHLPMEAVEQGVQMALNEQTAEVQKRTGYLATIANVATLLGLFGTIAGLIFSFEAVGHADPQQKSALLSAGISSAMNATMLGLAVAIPCMVAFALLMSKSNRIIGDMEEAAARSVDVLKLRFYAADADMSQSNGRGAHQGAEVAELRRAS